MKNFKQYNESIRDKMSPVSEEDIKRKMGDQRYTQYKKLLDVKEILDKKPFLCNLSVDGSPMSLLVQSELNDFNISYINNKYKLYSVFEADDYIIESKKELINKITEITLKSLDSYVKHRKIEIDEMQSNIEEMIEMYSDLKINY